MIQLHKGTDVIRPGKEGMDMSLTTKEIENRIESATSWEEMEKILRELPGTTLYSKVDELCQKYHKTIPQAAELAGMATSSFYAMLNGTRPRRKEQFIRLAFALELSLEELNELLKLAKLKELYAKNTEDAIIIFGLQKKKTPEEIDMLLEEKGCQLRFKEYRD